MSGDNTSIIIEQLRKACNEKAGILMIINVDNFTLFGDVYGKDIAGQVLKTCMIAIDSITNEDDIKARLGDDEFVVYGVPNSYGEHAVEFLKALLAPFCIGIQDYFSITIRFKCIALLSEFCTEFLEIIDLTVEDDGVSLIC